MLDKRQTSVAERIAHTLKRHAVEVIFGQSVPTAVLLAAEQAGIRQITYRQENMGGAMADGYGRVSGRIPVIAAQNGPAAAILVAPLAEALKASTPIVALVQEIETSAQGRNAFQEFDHQALFHGCTKWLRHVLAADRIEDHIDAAFLAAGSGRPGPAVLLLPKNIISAAAGAPSRRARSLGHWPIDRPRPDQPSIDAAAARLAAARFPVVMAGGGAVSPAAADALMRLQDVASLPVFTTTMGKGAVDETHPLSGGALASLTGPGSLGHRVRDLVAQADVVLLVGTRTNEDGTDSWRLIPRDADVIQVDIDPEEIGRNYEAVRLVGDAAETMTALADALAKLDLSQRRHHRPALAEALALAWSAFEKDRAPFAESDASPIRPEHTMHELQHLLTARSIVVGDASYSSSWITGHLRATHRGMRFITPRGLAGLGWGVPLAIGAKIARPDHQVVAVVGDGGFAHAWAELETLTRAGIAITIIVLNNGVLGEQKDAETVKFGRYTSACHLGAVDHAAIARACGCQAARIENPSDLRPALTHAFNASTPWLLDVVTDPGAHPPLSLFDEVLDHKSDSGIRQEAVR